jgi:protocatechuate 3,4-dioxygenase beta subunit
MPKRSTLKHRQAAARGALPTLAAILFACALAPAALAQREAPASVSGRVTDGERGVAGVTVALLSNDPSRRFRAAARARTDVEGRFHIANVTPGRYQVTPYAPAFVVQGATNQFPPGRPLTVLAGEEIKDLDFRVERGGVITGRVTDGDGNPVVAEAVVVAPVEVNAQTPPRNNYFDMRDQMTDDRGVYRIYGLAPGRYRVSVGQGGDEAGAVSYGRRKIFRRTYHPDTTEQAQARVVEVKSGDEAADVDITLGKPLKTYRASGRFVSVETGQPVPGLTYGYGTLDAAGRRVGSYGSGQPSNAGGEFQTEGLAPGRYMVFNLPGQEVSEFYTEPAMFEIVDADVTGLVVRVKRGASVSGVVVIEGVSDRALTARLLSEVRVYGWLESRSQVAPPFTQRPTPVGPDGSFRVGGLRPGKLRLGYAGDTSKGLLISRVELNGANVTGGVEVAEGAQVTGVRLVLSYGTAVITGQTSFVNGAPPPGARATAHARRAGATTAGDGGRSVEVDARGYFRIEGLPAGEYEITVRVFGAGRMHRSEPLTVSVADGGETRVAPVVDFNKQ